MSASRPNIALKPNEPLQRGFHRLLGPLAVETRRLARPSARQRPTAIHDGRILIKRLRALLWFVRPALDREARIESQQQLRQAAGLLAGPRDSTIARETLKKMAHKASAPDDRKALTQAERTLREMEPLAFATLLSHAMEQVSRALPALRKQVETAGPWPLPSARLAQAMRQLQRAGKKALHTGKATPHHLWRKKAKRLLYLLEMAHPHPDQAKARFIRRLAQLQNALGLSHDCVITRHYLPRKTTKAYRCVRQLLRHREKHFQVKAARHARHLHHLP